MATMNGPPVLHKMVPRKGGRFDLASSLKDPRQWPALGEAAQLQVGELRKDEAMLDGQPDGHTVSSSHTDSAHNFERRNSADDAANAKKKLSKTKWIPLKLNPVGGISLEEKIRLRRQQNTARFAGDAPPVFRQSARPQELDRQRPPPRTYGYSGSYYSRPYHHAVNNRSDAFIPAQNLGINFPKPRPKFSRKVHSLRNREIMYDSEFVGRDADQSDGADDISVTEGYDNYEYYGGYYGDDGSQAQYNWTNYNGVSMDASYLSEGYGGSCTGEGEEFDSLSYYGMDMTGTSMDPNYYCHDQENGGYVFSSEAELKEMIKSQIEYYFSPENLQKDFFLRRNMAEDGSVSLSLVASFLRMRSLTQDLYVISEAVGDSNYVELMDGFMVRSRNHPEVWPLKDDDDRSGSYYFAAGEAPADADCSSWTYYEEDFGLGSEKTSGHGEDGNESAHCEDEDFDAEEGYEEEEEECEDILLDGYESSQFSDELNRIKSKSDLAEMVSANLMQPVM